MTKNHIPENMKMNANDSNNACTSKTCYLLRNIELVEYVIELKY